MRNWEEEVEGWAYIHFVVFVYLHIAMADNEIIDSEWRAMRRQFEKFDSPLEFEEVIDKVMYCYKQCNDIRVLEVIEYFREHHATSEASRQQLLRDVHHIASSHEGVAPGELAIEMHLRKLLS